MSILDAFPSRIQLLVKIALEEFHNAAGSKLDALRDFTHRVQQSAKDDPALAPRLADLLLQESQRAGIEPADAKPIVDDLLGNARQPESEPFSDEWLALRFTAAHGDDLRYVKEWGKWLEWVRGWWQHDRTGRALDLARAVCRSVAVEAKDTSISSARTVAAVERLARVDRTHAATADQWDVDPWLLSTDAGTVDLQTGETRKPRREDYLTKRTAVAPSDADCPLWKRFLSEITGGNEELQAYLQRIAGYCLTGSTTEQALFFLYGAGANGKSVFVNTLADVMADYATSAPMEAFTSSSSDRHPTELAGLQGARLVVASETEQGRHWAEKRIKLATGGDKIPARFMRGDFFLYTPTFKLVIVGNHKPKLRGINEAMRRRFHLIPFTVTIPPDKRDHDLAEKLRQEWPAILKWMIDGCAEWQRVGLNPPDIVVKATDDYFAEEDTLSTFLAECCTIGPNKLERSASLFHVWKEWAKDAGAEIGNSRGFSEALEERGFVKKRHAEGMIWHGIALACDEEEQEKEDLEAEPVSG
jgi:putative DNA primase/helicase